MTGEIAAKMLYRLLTIVTTFYHGYLLLLLFQNKHYFTELATIYNLHST